MTDTSYDYDARKERDAQLASEEQMTNQPKPISAEMLEEAEMAMRLPDEIGRGLALRHYGQRVLLFERENNAARTALEMLAFDKYGIPSTWPSREVVDAALGRKAAGEKP